MKIRDILKNIINGSILRHMDAYEKVNSYHPQPNLKTPVRKKTLE